MLDIRLKPGVTAASAIGSLEQLLVGGRNIASGGGGIDPMQYRGQFLQLTEDAARAVNHLFKEPDPLVVILQGEQYHLLLDLESKLARPHATIQLEAGALVGRLETIVGRLRREVQSFELPANCVVVLPDTSCWLHCSWYQDIDWPKEVKARLVRLVVPDVVLDELDSKSYASLPTGPRAKQVMRSLLSLHGADDSPETPVEVPKRKGVTLQFLVDDEDWERLSNRDGEILRRAEELAGIVGKGHLVIATRDGGQILRARSRGLRTLWLEDEKS